MATAVSKITLSPSRDIPLDKLVLSQSNVRRIKAGISIEELAEDIARRTLLQSLSVRPVLETGGKETGMFEIPAGGRRFRALQVLVKQKRLAKTALVPCVIREGGAAEEDSLAENVHREALHPLDQFRAFLALRETGLGEEEIAARFFVTPAVVRQRMRLASVSEKILTLYSKDELSLEQVMAFSVSTDQVRQEQVLSGLAHSHNCEPFNIRRKLTEGAVNSTDPRARFIGIETYEAAGGTVLHDLFDEGHGGWLQDPALLDRLVSDKLTIEAETVRAEGWQWVEVATDFRHGHTAGMRRIAGEIIEMTKAEMKRLAALEKEREALELEYRDDDELPEDVTQRLDHIDDAIDKLQARPVRYDPAEVAQAGAFLSLHNDGSVRVECGYIRANDEAAAADDEPGLPLKKWRAFLIY